MMPYLGHAVNLKLSVLNAIQNAMNTEHQSKVSHQASLIILRPVDRVVRGAGCSALFLCMSKDDNSNIIDAIL